MATQALRARSDNRSLGIVLMLGAFACFAGIDVSARWLTRESGMPPMEATLVRYLGHLAIVSALFLPLYGRGLVRTATLGHETLRGLFLLASTICNFTAVSYLPLSLTGAIFFAVPIVVCLLSVPLLGERIGVRRWTAILVGFGGVLLVTWPFGEDVHPAMLASVGAVVFAALYLIWTRRLAGVDPTNTQQFYTALVATIGIAPFALVNWVWPPDAKGWIAFCAIGFFGWFGHQLLTIAHRYAPATTLAPLFYSQLIFLTFADFLVFHVAPDPWIFVGAAVVLAAGVYIWLREHALSREAAAQKGPR